MNAVKINKTFVDGLRAGDRDIFRRDSELKGFAVKVTPQGRKVYVVDYRMPGSRRSARYTIGPHGSPWTTDQARKEAKRVLLEASQGNDPNHEKRQRRAEKVDFRFHAYCDRFVEQYLRPNWPGSYDRGQSVLRRHAKPFFKSRDIREITKRDCTAFIDGLADMAATARKAAEVVGKLFRWAEDRGEIDRSPMDRTPRPKPSPARERVLSDGELSTVWYAAEAINHPYGRLVQMLILTGQRRGEVGGMRWDEVDRDAQTWSVPSGRTKSGQGHTTPLTPSMVTLLRQVDEIGSLVFSTSGEKELGNHSKLKKKLDMKIDELRGDEEPTMEPWTLHDLRRTVATGLQRLGVQSDLIERLQGRTVKLGAGARYQRHDYLEERRIALDRWNRHLHSLVQQVDLAA